ncbi:VPLPA-CTERM sorting domain-containing protein [Hyphococcus sp.]|jgi:hypothetical protein|uniref:VPLPA-CTERM sorting domain-containing protein n=1 Tax=Hyphococcus sp. TaxID=2038636 RepID=UPI003D0A7E9F
MKFRSLIIAAAALASSAGAANAATFVFKGDGNNVTPLGAEGVDYVRDCGTAGSDYCTIDHAAGFDYELDGIALNVVAYADGGATRLIQDVVPGDSGLGAYSESNANDDQTQADSNEAIEFTFDDVVTLTDVEFNAGGDVNCSSFGDEGPCGDFRLTIDGMVIGVLAAEDMIANLGTGMSFLLEAITPEAGFTIAQFTTSVSDVPVPAALPLLLSGIAGLGFASRRRRDPLAVK